MNAGRRFFLGLASAVGLWGCVNAAVPAPIETAAGALGPMGHVQGMDVTDEAIFLSHDRGLVKLDWSGKVLKKVSAPRHTGDICVWKGEVYTATHVVKPDHGLIEVYDADLRLVRSKTLDYGVDGITCVDGRLYLGFCRSHPRPMRGHTVVFADAATLQPCGTCGIDYGVETSYGPQDMAYDGTNVWMMFYTKGVPGCGRFTKDLVASEQVKASFGNGFCVAPRRLWTEGRPVYMSCRMLSDPAKKAMPRVRISFHEFREGRFVAAGASDGTGEGGWEPSVRQALDELVRRHRGDSAAYAVFDFDYTLALGDSSYVCLWQILEGRDFRGGDMVKLMGEGLPDDLKPRVRDVFAAADGVETAKRFWPLYRHIWNTWGDGFACEWRSRLFAGYSADDLSELARTAMWANRKRIGHRPDANVPSERRGFVILLEVVQLVQDLQAAGIAVYVVSGSRTELLKVATGSEFGFGIPSDRVFGCDSGVVAGQKTAFIRTRLAPRHQDKDPVLVVGDSMGDYGMFTELPGVERALVFRRRNARPADAPLRQLIETAPGPQGKFLIQGRDEPNGRMIPSHESRF